MKKALAPKFDVGDATSFTFGGETVEGFVVEDRGPLGAGGKHLYRIMASFTPEEIVDARRLGTRSPFLALLAGAGASN